MKFQQGSFIQSISTAVHGIVVSHKTEEYLKLDTAVHGTIDNGTTANCGIKQSYCTAVHGIKVSSLLKQISSLTLYRSLWDNSQIGYCSFKDNSTAGGWGFSLQFTGQGYRSLWDSILQLMGQTRDVRWRNRNPIRHTTLKNLRKLKNSFGKPLL